MQRFGSRTIFATNQSGLSQSYVHPGRLPGSRLKRHTLAQRGVRSKLQGFVNILISQQNIQSTEKIQNHS